MSRFADPPPSAAWHHHQARSGFEVVFFTVTDDAVVADGTSVAVEDDVPWRVDYSIELDRAWATTRAQVRVQSDAGRCSVTVETIEPGRWSIDQQPARHLDGCYDVDLEASALTNALPVHRLGLLKGHQASAPAVYVRARDAAIERLEQRYARRDSDDTEQEYDYEAPAFAFTSRLTYDRFGLVVDYPGIARRAF